MYFLSKKSFTCTTTGQLLNLRNLMSIKYYYLIYRSYWNFANFYSTFFLVLPVSPCMELPYLVVSFKVLSVLCVSMASPSLFWLECPFPLLHPTNSYFKTSTYEPFSRHVLPDLQDWFSQITSLVSLCENCHSCTNLIFLIYFISHLRMRKRL